MKTLNNYINEVLVKHNLKNEFNYYPQTKEELQKIIIDRIEREGPECNLNDIDVSEITDMSKLFNAYSLYIFREFNGDISKWDVSNVTNMRSMFFGCVKFNCDISKWDVSKVKNTRYMFFECYDFNQNISKWNVSKVEHYSETFEYCDIEEKNKPKFK